MKIDKIKYFTLKKFNSEQKPCTVCIMLLSIVLQMGTANNITHMKTGNAMHLLPAQLLLFWHTVGVHTMLSQPSLRPDKLI